MDELPQSAAGRTIMTTEPKFIPEAGGATSASEDGAAFSVRMIDCVGYIVPSSLGYMENDAAPHGDDPLVRRAKSPSTWRRRSAPGR